MLWQYWSTEWELNERVSFNGDLRTIVVHAGVTDLDIRTHVYSAWVRWRSRGNDAFFEAMRRTGFEPIPSGVTGDTYFLINGWKLLVDLRKVKVKGVLFSDDFVTAYYDLDTGLPLYPAEVSSVVNTVFSGGGSGGATAADIWNYNSRTLTSSGLTAVQVRQEMDNNSTKLQQIKAKTDTITASPTTTQIADAVRVELTPELAHILTLENNPGITPTQSAMLLEMYNILGLDPTIPLIVTKTGRFAGPSIRQSITTNSEQTTVQRVP